MVAPMHPYWKIGIKYGVIAASFVVAAAIGAGIVWRVSGGPGA